ncbi:hypothetical protein [Glutamicibacter sp. NPDC087344]|uniref:hypothetical protein n=1 Tax=Glutamicibacter sp. NPDC087344 TaxID=3363994 RepID=UPI0037FFA0B6
MTSKTFKSVEETRELHVKELGKHFTLVINYKDAGRSGITLAPSDAPALALAILEAAGWPNEYLASNEILRRLSDFDKHLKEMEAEAKQQAELEAEALEYYKKFTGYTHTTLDSACSPDKWLAVARKARELADKRAER